MGKSSSISKTIITNAYKTVEACVKQADKDTLIIFDVDEVLVHPKDQILKINHINNMAELFDQIKVRLTLEQAWELQSIILLQSEYEPVNNDIIRLIAETQKNGINTIALTQLMTGTFGKVSSLEDWRVNSLNAFGYDFSKSWATLKDRKFDDMPSILYPSEFPMFKQGVIFTCDHSKDKILKAFLHYAKFQPKKIILIDDMEKHIHSIANFANEENIEFLGVKYTAAYDFDKEPFNAMRAQLQLETLESKHIWLSDKEADEQINKGEI
jgi:thymidine kinase